MCGHCVMKGLGGRGGGISDTNWRGRRAWSSNVYKACCHHSLSVKLGFVELGMWPRGLH